MAEYIRREPTILAVNMAMEKFPYTKDPERPQTYSMYNEGWTNACDCILGMIEAEDTADVAPVVHSRFVNMGGFPACERCGASPGVWEPKPNNPSGFPLYCYACGAKMDKEAGDGA